MHMFFRNRTNPQFLIILTCLLLSGCSVISVAYNNVDTLIRWTASDYFDFNASQQTQFDRSLRRIHAWHRKEELPKYAMLCTEMAKRVEAGLTSADLDWADNVVEERRIFMAQYISGDLAAVLSTIKIEQIDIMNMKLAKENEKFRKEHLDGTPEALEKKHVKKSIERIEDWIGGLGADQMIKITAMLKTLPQNSEYRYAYRITRQQMLRELLGTGLSKNELEIGLRDWLENWGDGRTSEQKQIWAERTNRFRLLILELDAILTPKQRLYLVKKLHDYARDFIELSAS